MKARKWVLTCALVVYGLGYAWVRGDHVLVHGVSYETDSGAKRYHHCVRAADLGPGLLFRSKSDLYVVESCFWVFTPLRLLESLTWHLVPRRYGI